MKTRQPSIKIANEDQFRLETIAEGLRVKEEEILEKILKGEYSSWNLDAIMMSEIDPDEEM